MSLASPGAGRAASLRCAQSQDRAGSIRRPCRRYERRSRDRAEPFKKAFRFVLRPVRGFLSKSHAAQWRHRAVSPSGWRGSARDAADNDRYFRPPATGVASGSHRGATSELIRNVSGRGIVPFGKPAGSSSGAARRGDRRRGRGLREYVRWRKPVWSAMLNDRAWCSCSPPCRW